MPEYLYKLKEILNPDPKKEKIKVKEYIRVEGCAIVILQEHPSAWERNDSIPNKPRTLYYDTHTKVAPEVWAEAVANFQAAAAAATKMAPLEKGGANG